jgi:hydrogenase maturation protein HypF
LEHINPRSHGVSEFAAPGLDRLSMKLADTPLHHLLLNRSDPILAREPAPPILVMTGGEFREGQVVTDNEDALQRLAPLADAFLLHDCEILSLFDKSV